MTGMAWFSHSLCHTTSEYKALNPECYFPLWPLICMMSLTWVCFLSIEIADEEWQKYGSVTPSTPWVIYLSCASSLFCGAYKGLCHGLTFIAIPPNAPQWGRCRHFNCHLHQTTWLDPVHQSSQSSDADFIKRGPLIGSWPLREYLNQTTSFSDDL